MAMVAVKTTLPALVGVTLVPLMLVIPAPAVLTLQTMVLLVAFAGLTVPPRVSGVPAVPELGTPVMFVTGTSAEVTVSSRRNWR